MASSEYSAELVVVAVVAVGGGALGKVAKIGLVLLFEKRVLRGEAVGDRFYLLGEDGSCEGNQQKQALA